MEAWREELYHHGILGMKWGVRRYQNKDGTLTEAGKRRLGQVSDNSRKVSFDEPSGRLEDGIQNRRRARAAIHENVARDYSHAGSVMQSGSSISRSAANINKQAAERKRQKAADQMDLSNMTDKELQAVINRMNLERNYKSLTTADTAKGHDYVNSIIATAGDVLAIGASAASIAVAIHQLRA